MPRFRPPKFNQRPTARTPTPRALILEAEGLLEQEDGDDEEIHALLAALPSELGDPDLHLRAGDCYLALGDLERAEAQFRSALALDPDDADALHGLGDVCAERGDGEAAAAAWRRVLALDAQAPRPDWALGEAEFEGIAEAALEELPERIRGLLSNVPIRCLDLPPEWVVDEGLDPRILGCFTGMPYPLKGGDVMGAPALDHIELYQWNIERASVDADDLREQIRITLIHETGHFFGLDDEDLEALGLG